MDRGAADHFNDAAQLSRKRRDPLDVRSLPLAERRDRDRLRATGRPRARHLGHDRRGARLDHLSAGLHRGRRTGFVYEQFVRTGSTLRNTGGFEIFTVPSLAIDVRNIMEANDAVVVTDGYGLSSTLDFYGGVPPVVIGYNAQGTESTRWYDPDMQPHRILFVDKEALSPRPGHPEDRGRPDFALQMQRACTRVIAGPTLGYEFHDSSGHLVPARLYFTTWCEGPRPHALRILQWDPRLLALAGAAYGAAM